MEAGKSQLSPIQHCWHQPRQTPQEGGAIGQAIHTWAGACLRAGAGNWAGRGCKSKAWPLHPLPEGKPWEAFRLANPSNANLYTI